jgi:alpha-amylase/alpha-mannosidase (GH57 family)
MEHYVCIHGHFYQPPRENAWLEQVEIQDSAYPYHDWNERVSAECYTPNAESRILDHEGYITKIVSNYSRVSFNFGPTLLSWLERSLPSTYEAIRTADRESVQRFSGHGSAIAQAYNHMIMPLANKRDKVTQVRWGLADFQHRFGRAPEGMWLPETAVDIETLDVLAENGIKFTILAPRQAARVRRIGDSDWQDASGEKVDPTTAYLQQLPSGRSIALFFYDGPIAKEVAFGGILSSGESLANRLTGAFTEGRECPQLVHLAVDGETFGHHHRFGDMALAYALDHIEANGLARITNYGEYLEQHPPDHEVEILENSSWSCIHGVERWRSDCGCNTGGHAGWNQAWRAPLRAALDWLRDAVGPLYEEQARRFVNDPWAARDDYIRIILDRSPQSIDAFLGQHAHHVLDAEERIKFLKLMELQRHAMLMYTSCGWFFDDLSGIETVQVMQYAGRVAQLAHELLGDDTEVKFLTLLSEARSNLREQGDGRRIYERFVKPAMVDLITVVAHFAVSSLFESYENEVKVFCYPVTMEDIETSEMGKARLAVGRVKLSSETTTESGLFAFGVLYFGEHSVNAGVREYQGDTEYAQMKQDLGASFASAEYAEVIRSLDRHFGASTYSLKSLFRDEQRKVMAHILESTLSDIEQVFRQLYEHHYPPMRYLTEMGNPLPKAFKDAAEFIINTDLRRVIDADTLDRARIETLVADAGTWGSELDLEGHGYLLQRTLGRMMNALFDNPDDADLLSALTAAVEMSYDLPFKVDLGEVQTLYYRMLPTARRERTARADGSDTAAADWLRQFDALGEHLKVRTG